MGRAHLLLNFNGLYPVECPREMPPSHRCSRLKVRAKVSEFHAHWRGSAPQACSPRALSDAGRSRQNCSKDVFPTNCKIQLYFYKETIKTYT